MPAVHATELQISTKGLVLPNGLRISSAAVLMPQPVVQTSPFLLKEGTIVDVDAVIEAVDLQAYLNRKQPSGLTEFAVKAEDGLLTVTAISHLLVTAQVGGQGTLEFSEGKLNFAPTRTEVGGVKMPDSMVKAVLGKLNPIIDLRGYPVDAKIKALTIADGVIRLSASLIVTAPIPRREP